MNKILKKYLGVKFCTQGWSLLKNSVYVLFFDFENLKFKKKSRKAGNKKIVKTFHTKFIFVRYTIINRFDLGEIVVGTVPPSGLGIIKLGNKSIHRFTNKVDIFNFKFFWKFVIEHMPSVYKWLRTNIWIKKNYY